MRINWLWDVRLDENDVRKILNDETNPRFNIYAEKLLSRVSDPSMTFNFIDKAVFCKKWPSIKKRIQKDRWLKNRVIFWQTIYERMKIADKIRNIRIKLGYTQEDTARKLGVIQQYISKIENGYENVSIDTLRRIADVFDKRLVVEFR